MMIPLADLTKLCQDVAWDLRESKPPKGHDEDRDGLAHALHYLREARRALGDAERDVEERLAAAMDAKTAIVAGLPTIERNWSPKKPTWSHEVIAKRIAAASQDERILDESTGVIETESEAATRILLTAAGISYWRKGRLKELGIDPKEVCDNGEDGRYTVRFLS